MQGITMSTPTHERKRYTMTCKHIRIEDSHKKKQLSNGALVLLVYVAAFQAMNLREQAVSYSWLSVQAPACSGGGGPSSTTDLSIVFGTQSIDIKV